MVDLLFAESEVTKRIKSGLMSSKNEAWMMFSVLDYGNSYSHKRLICLGY
jgi:hypothetical protein